MQLKTFKLFISKVVNEGNRLQKINIDGIVTTRRKFTTIQTFAIVVSIVSLFILNKGFTDNFAGFIIGFLGIFIGLFGSIVISTFDSKRILFQIDDDSISSEERGRLKRVKNYLIQFTGLTSYSILIAIIVIILLSLVLLDVGINSDIYQYQIVESINDINLNSFLISMKFIAIIFHRFFTVYFLINFFSITIYSITSYFSFLQSEYKKI